MHLKSQGRHSIIKNSWGGGGGSWLNILGSRFWLGKNNLGFFKNIYLDNSYGVAKIIHIIHRGTVLSENEHLSQIQSLSSRTVP